MNVETGFPSPELRQRIPDANLPQALSSAFTMLGVEGLLPENIDPDITLQEIQELADLYDLSVTADYVSHVEVVESHLQRGEQIIGRVFQNGRVHATHIQEVDDMTEFPRMLNRSSNNNGYPLSLVRATNDFKLMGGYNIFIIYRQRRDPQFQSV